MTPNCPAYYLDRDPAEAAEFLAKLAVASRRVGGFVKAADMPPEVAAVLRNGLIGAGVGGVAGGISGLLNRKRRNPLRTALTGALIGGGLGASGTALKGVYDSYAGNGPQGGPASMTDQAAASQDTALAAAAAAKTPAARLIERIPGLGGPAPVGPRSTAAQKNHTLIDDAKGAAGQAIDAGGQAFQQDPLRTGLSVGGGIAGTAAGIRSGQTAARNQAINSLATDDAAMSRMKSQGGADAQAQALRTQMLNRQLSPTQFRQALKQNPALAAEYKATRAQTPSVRRSAGRGLAGGAVGSLAPFFGEQLARKYLRRTLPGSPVGLQDLPGVNALGQHLQGARPPQAGDAWGLIDSYKGGGR